MRAQVLRIGVPTTCPRRGGGHFPIPPNPDVPGRTFPQARPPTGGEITQGLAALFIPRADSFVFYGRSVHAEREDSRREERSYISKRAILFVSTKVENTTASMVRQPLLNQLPKNDEGKTVPPSFNG